MGEVRHLQITVLRGGMTAIMKVERAKTSRSVLLDLMVLETAQELVVLSQLEMILTQAVLFS